MNTTDEETQNMAKTLFAPKETEPNTFDRLLEATFGQLHETTFTAQEAK